MDPYMTFYVHQTEGYEFIVNIAEHVRIAWTGSSAEKEAAATRYKAACRINYLCCSDEEASWRFTALSEAEFQEGLKALRAAAAFASITEAVETE